MTKELFRAPLSFAALPVSQDFKNADVAILGIPYDCGEHAHRIGARMGPRWIRQHSDHALLATEDADPSPLGKLRVIDAGDVNVESPDFRDILVFFDKTEKAVGEILDAGCIPVTMGGDGAVTLPQIRAVAARNPGLVVIHFDAHTDAYPIMGNGDFDNGNTFSHAAREGLLNTSASIHAGLRGIVNTKTASEMAEDIGYRTLTVSQLSELSLGDAAASIRQPLENSPVYLCFDLDFFDPAFAPGVCTPTPGGVTSQYGLELLRQMAGLNIVACDVNTMSPPHDPDESTANLAATVMMECIGLIDASQK